MVVFPRSMYAQFVYLVPRRECQIPSKWSYKRFSAFIYMPEIKPGSSRTGAHNCWVISSVLLLRILEACISKWQQVNLILVTNWKSGRMVLIFSSRVRKCHSNEWHLVMSPWQNGVYYIPWYCLKHHHVRDSRKAYSCFISIDQILGTHLRVF